MAVNLNVQEYAAQRRAGQPVVIAVHNYLRIGIAGETPLYIQEGRIEADAGPAILPDDAPDWFWQEIANPQHCSLQALAAVDGLPLLEIARDKAAHRARVATEPTKVRATTPLDRFLEENEAPVRRRVARRRVARRQARQPQARDDTGHFVSRGEGPDATAQ
jgi:hypothetical protein